VTAGAERIPLAAAEAVRPALRRTRVARIALALALVGTLAAAFALALDRNAAPTLLPGGSDGVIVLDVSGSIGPREHRQLVQALDEALAEKRRYGLVVFSDDAYEVFPPGTDPEQVRFVRRFFVPAKGARRRLGTYRVGDDLFLRNPWTGAFTGGTRISRGLELAREIVHRDRLAAPAVLLISDLDYDVRDGGAIERELAEYRRQRIQLGIVGLASPLRAEDFLENFGSVKPTQLARPVTSFVGGGTVTRVRAPALLAAACLAVLLLLAVNELVCGRLTWAREQREDER
jgi:hypothetical protein